MLVLVLILILMEERVDLLEEVNLERVCYSRVETETLNHVASLAALAVLDERPLGVARIILNLHALTPDEDGDNSHSDSFTSSIYIANVSSA